MFVLKAPTMTQSILPTQYFASEGQPAPISLGCWAFGGKQWGGQDDADSLAVLRRAREAGLTHWDTAQGYGSGRSESICGEILSGHRKDIFIASKGSTEKSADAILEKLERSLERLGTDWIDLYYVHWPKSGVDLRPQMELLERARAAGKIRFIGVSNFSCEQMDQCREVGTIDAHQLNYSLFWRSSEKELIPYCQANGIAVVTYSSIAQGILTGKFPRHPDFAPDDNRPNTYFFRDDVWPHLYEATEQLKALARRAGEPLLHLAIQWVQQQAGVASVIVGARNLAQLESNLQAVKTPLEVRILTEMTALSDEVLSRLPPAPNNLFGVHR
jgi:aryl-alcohol dehydrogenase-like predicted oxidoreductase